MTTHEHIHKNMKNYLKELKDNVSFALSDKKDDKALLEEIVWATKRFKTRVEYLNKKYGKDESSDSKQG